LNYPSSVSIGRTSSKQRQPAKRLLLLLPAELDFLACLYDVALKDSTWEEVMVEWQKGVDHPASFQGLEPEIGTEVV
jgi:hypothetical protein